MINEFKKRKKLSDAIPWLLLEKNGVVFNKNGSLQKTFKYRGFDLISSTGDQISNLTARANNLLKRIEKNWTLHVEVRRVKATEYIESDFEYLAGRLIEEERKEHFVGNNAEYYYNECYVTLTYLVPKDMETNISTFFVEKNIREFLQDTTLEDFNKNFKRFFNLFKEIFLEAVELDQEETLTFLHSCVSEKNHKIKVPEVPFALANMLCDTPLLRNLTNLKLGNKYIVPITIIGLPNFTEPCFLDELNNLPFEYRWVSRFTFLGKNTALNRLEQKYKSTMQGKIKFLTRVINELSGKDSDDGKVNLDVIKKADEIESQINLVRGDYLAQGYYVSTIFVEDESQQNLEKKVEYVEKVFENKGFTVIKESVNAKESFLGSVPGEIFSNMREPILNSIQFTHLFPITSIWVGDSWNKHLNAPPLLYTETDGTNPFFLNLHVGDVGHTAVIGPTGSGKSVFLAMLYTQFKKYKNSQIFIFDKGASSKVPTYANGGVFYDLGVDDISFQPLRNVGYLKDEISEIEKTRVSQEMEWANDWILDIFEQENVILTPLQKEKVWSSLELISNSSLEQRTLTAFSNFLADTSMQEALSPYLITGSLGKYFDSDYENLKENSSWNVFEMNQILNNKKALVPLLMYLFHKIEVQLTGEPTLLVLDECWAFFDNPVFAGKIREWLKVLRRKNTSVIFATQELSDIINSPLFTAVNDACKTKIFLANPNAKTEVYLETYKKFSVNDEEIEIIAEATEKKDYLIKTSTGYARKFSLALGEKTLKLVASSRVEELAEADYIFKTCGNSADEFTKKFLKGE
ncbi:MAG: ATPase [Cetobacterium sp.]